MGRIIRVIPGQNSPIPTVPQHTYKRKRSGWELGLLAFKWIALYKPGADNFADRNFTNFTFSLQS